jgi:dienelactone hydrolase
VFTRILVAGLIATQPLLAQTVRTVRLSTPDDVGIAASYYPPATNSAPAVLLLHGLGTNRDEWTTFAPLLQHLGYAALAIDFRGHGESTRRLTADGPQLIDYQNFTPRDYQDLLLDTDTAFNWLAKQPGVDPHRIAIAGSALGANLALRYAAFNEDAAAFLLLSPALVYEGVRADDVIGKVGERPLKIVVSRDDGFAFESSKKLMELRKSAGGTNELIVCTGFVRGAALLTGVKDLPGITLAWLRQALTPAP